MFGFTLIVTYICGAAINSWKWIDTILDLYIWEKQMLLHNRVDICFFVLYTLWKSTSTYQLS